MMPDQVIRQLQALDKLNDTLPPKVMTPELYRKLKAPFALLRRSFERWRCTAGYSGEGEHRFRRETERRSGAKVNSSRSEATLA
jgi:hypothetical protein